jgi:hypothetical protein
MKNILPVWLVLLCSSVSFAQSPLSFDHFGSNNDDLSYAVCKDESGCFYTSGFFKGTMMIGTTSLISDGAEDMYVAKHNSAGQIVWAKKAGGSDYDAGYSISYHEGFVYVTGAFGGTANFEGQLLSSSGAHDGFIAKYDSSGNFIWAKKAGSSSSLDRADQIVFGNGNTMYLCASIFDGSSYGATVLSSNGGEDAYILKLDTAGSLLDYINIGGSSNDYCYDLKLVNGHLYIAGDFHSNTIMFGTTSKSKNGDYDGYLAKYDLSLNEVWGNTGGGAMHDDFQKVIVDANGNCYATGNFNTSITFGSQTLNAIVPGPVDGFLVKYDVNGAFVWARKMGAYSEGAGRDLAFGTTESEIMLCGFFGVRIDNASLSVASAGGRDGCIITYDAAGTAGSMVTFGGSGNESTCEFVKIGNDLWMSGAQEGNTSFNSLAYTSNGGSDIAIWHFGTPATGVDDDAAGDQLSEYKLYSNPAQYSITLESKAVIETLEVFDLAGKCVYADKPKSTRVIANFDLAGGIYFVVINADHQNSHKLVIE